MSALGRGGGEEQLLLCSLATPGGQARTSTCPGQSRKQVDAEAQTGQWNDERPMSGPRGGAQRMKGLPSEFPGCGVSGPQLGFRLLRGKAMS